MLDPTEMQKQTENLDECNPPVYFLRILKIIKKQRFSKTFLKAIQ